MIVFGRVVEPGQCAQEGRVVEAERVAHLVHYRQLHRPQHARLPESHDRAADCFLLRRLLLRREMGTVAFGQQRGDLPVTVQNALALHFGRMCGEHRAHRGAIEKTEQSPGIDTHLQCPLHGMGDGSLARCRSRDRVGPGAAYVMLVLGDVGKLREIAEGAHHLAGLGG